MSFSVVSFLLLTAYMMFGILENPATSIGDLNLLSVILFIVSFPLFIVVHLWITVDLLLLGRQKTKAESSAQLSNISAYH